MTPPISSVKKYKYSRIQDKNNKIIENKKYISSRGAGVGTVGDPIIIEYPNYRITTT